MQQTDSQQLEVQDQRGIDGDAILTKDQRKALYRSKLTTRQKEMRLRLKHFILGRRRYIRQLDLIPRRKRAEDTDIMCRFFNGDQYGRYNDLGLYEDDRQDGDFAYTLPVLAGHVEQAFLQIFKVHPNYTAEAKNKNNSMMKLLAKMCEDLGVEELDRVMGNAAQSEVYTMILGGESHRFVGWEPDRVSPKVITRTRYKKKVIETAGHRECGDCKAIVGADDDQCAECQSKNITDVPGAQATQQVPEQYEVAVGQNVVHIPHMLAVQRDLSAIEPDDSTFLVEYSYLDRHVAEWEYQSPIEDTHEGLPIEMQLRYDLERGSNQTDAVIGSARLAPPGREGAFGLNSAATGMIAGRKQPQEVHYWDPSQYGQYYFAQDETLPNGEVVKADTLWGDYHPKGVKVVIVGDTIMEIEPCMYRRKHTLVRYGRLAGSNSGAGLKKIIPLQNAENDNFNLNQTIKHTVGHPFTVINGQYVQELPGAGNVLKVTRAGLDDVGKVARQYPGQSMSQGDGSAQIIEQAMQFIAGTNTVGGSSIVGAPDMRAAGTATGIAAMQEQAADRQIGPVDERIRADKEMIIQLLENIQEYSTDEQKQELSLRFGPDVVKAFFNTNLRHAITIGIKANTDMPRSMALQAANFIAFGQAIGQILPVAQQFPWVMEFLSDFATAMGFPTSIGEGRDDRREAEFRLNILAEIEVDLMKESPNITTDDIGFAAAMHAKLAQTCAPLIDKGDASDPTQMGPDQLPNEVEIPRIFMQVHDSFMDVYKDALFGETAKSWSNARKLVVIQLWLDHLKAKMSQQDVMAKLQAQLNAQMNPQPQQPPDTSKEDAEAQAASEKDAQVRDLHVQAAQHDAGEQSKDNDLQRKIIEENYKRDMQPPKNGNGNGAGIDKNTAQRLLAASGGNKTKARRMAARLGVG